MPLNEESVFALRPSPPPAVLDIRLKCVKVGSSLPPPNFILNVGTCGPCEHLFVPSLPEPRGVLGLSRLLRLERRWRHPDLFSYTDREALWTTPKGRAIPLSDTAECLSFLIFPLQISRKEVYSSSPSHFLYVSVLACPTFSV